MGSSRTGTVDCEIPSLSPRLGLTSPGSDGVDTTGNPLQVSITTNTTGPLNLVATVSSPAGRGGWC